MMDRPKISLIMATYNRGPLIAATLRSIQEQTYEHLECIIIDDGSTDDTEHIVQPFVEADARFSYQSRPEGVAKGANACRNYGFTISKGAYVKFFDSDDLMLPEHLAISIEVMRTQKLDFVVADCRNFDENGLRERPYETDKNHTVITAEDFARFRNGWITNDLLVSRAYAQKIEFNEQIRDLASEYQYCIKLLLLTQNGILIPDIVTHRRVHSGSIFVQMTDDDLKWKSLLAENKLFTESYVRDVAPLALRQWFLSGVVQYNFDIALSGEWPQHTFKIMQSVGTNFSYLKAFVYPVAIATGMLFKKGYNLIKYIRTTTS